MKNNYSNILVFNDKTLKKTTRYLRNANIAGLPTETVYGLGGNAYSKSAVQKIFKLKARPKSNPLIVHYHDLNIAMRDIQINRYFLKLYKKLCPGPITFILKKKKNSKIHPLTSAKLNSIAIRFPKHKVIRSILKNINFPLAMPSANKSKSISPVSAFDVFDGKIARILGLESKFGMEFDSMADTISFCVVPSILIYSLYVDNMSKLVGIFISFMPLMFGTIRLAKFNINYPKKLISLTLKG